MADTTTANRQFGRCGFKGCRTRVVLDLATVRAHTAGYVFCAEHRCSLAFGKVKGMTTGDPCGPRCWNATTATCKCSCGGAEHGSTA